MSTKVLSDTEAELKVPVPIAEFLHQNTNLSLAVASNNIPYCANCFYAYDRKSNCLVFKSEIHTRHIQKSIFNNIVAGTICPDTLVKTHIRGVQFQGNLFKFDSTWPQSVRTSYYKKYPFAAIMKGELWVIRLSYLKMTENKIGIGNKTIWGILNEGAAEQQ